MRRIAPTLLAAGCALLSACTGSAVRPDAPAVVPDARVLFARALAAQEGGEPDQAEGLWKQVIAAAPRYAAPHTNLGILYRASGKLDDAIREYEAAIQLDPTDAAAYHNLGLAHRARGAWADAERAYLRALEHRPEQAETHYNLAILYDLFLDRPEDALAQYRAVLSLGGPDVDAVEQWIRTLERRLAQPEPIPTGVP
jgi:tetratricopeptide (TPR) repeat protein